MRPGHGGGGRTERAPSTTQRESLETEGTLDYIVQDQIQSVVYSIGNVSTGKPLAAV